MELNWDKIDAFFGKLANWLLVAIVIAALLALTHKVIIGEYMMYQDYYDTKVKSVQ